MKKYITSVLLLSLFTIHISAQDKTASTYFELEEEIMNSKTDLNYELSDDFEVLKEDLSIDLKSLERDNQTMKELKSNQKNRSFKKANNSVVRNVANPSHHVAGGDVYIETIGYGMIIKSPDSQCWRYTPDNNGILIQTCVTCPTE